MGNFFAPEKTGLTLQKIAKVLAAIAILTAVLGLLFLLVKAADGEDIDQLANIIVVALAAEVFSCLLLHGFGVLVDSAYCQRVEATRQTQLLNQLLAAQKAGGAAQKPAAAAYVPVRKPVVEPQPAPAPVSEAAPAEEPKAAEETVPAPAENESAKKNPEILDMLGKALSYTDPEQRRKFLFSMMSRYSDYWIRMVCRRAVGMNDAQLIDLIAEFG